MPRLELCAALELSRSVSTVLSDLCHKPDKIVLYTDSRIVLGYINNNQKRFSKYVERRINNILALTKQDDWKYVKTSENPADIASRPHTPLALQSSMWLSGPQFLKLPSNISEDQDDPTEIEETLPEEKKITNVLCFNVNNIQGPFYTLFRRISQLNRLISVVKCVLRLRHKLDVLRQKRGITLAPRKLTYSTEEVTQLIVKEAQKECFEPIKSLLRLNKNIPDHSKVSKLSPRLDSNDILRVGGRLKAAEIPFSVKHPILIPQSHPLASMIIVHFHNINKHQGSHISHGAINQAGYFIENGRQLIRKVIRGCVTCRKLRSQPENQLMADLPIDRVTPDAPFTSVGIDVFGHFFIHDGVRTRSSNPTKKIWAIIFVCLPSRAIHLEPLNSMDTTSFRNAFSRFTAIRGDCKLIRSDQGKNFISVKRQIEGLDISELSNEFAAQGIDWILNPPYASHHGGSWERKIGSVRRVLEASIALMSNRGMSRDEFHTLLAEASKIVNNTPLTVNPNHPDDPTPLSPSMLLTLKEPTPSPLLDNYSEKDIMSYGKRRYRRVQFLSEQFWCRWRTEYLQSLTQRHKWKTTRPCITEGDVVLVRTKNVPRSHWPLGKIITATPSSDGLVRSATISLPPLPGSSSKRITSRAITDLVLLVPSSKHPNCTISSQKLT